MAIESMIHGFQVRRVHPHLDIATMQLGYPLTDSFTSISILYSCRNFIELAACELIRLGL